MLPVRLGGNPKLRPLISNYSSFFFFFKCRKKKGLAHYSERKANAESSLLAGKGRKLEPAVWKMKIHSLDGASGKASAAAQDGRGRAPETHPGAQSAILRTPR